MKAECAASVPLVCLHGWAMSAAVWQPLVDKLPLQRTVICPDLPGHGNAAVLPRMDLDSIADALAASINSASVWVGWSLGAMIAVHMAGRHPGKVAGLVLLANTPRFVSATDWPDAVQEAVFKDFAHDLAQDYGRSMRRFMALQVLGVTAGDNMREQVRRLQQKMSAPDPAALQQGLDVLLHTDQREDYRQLSVPVTCILGSEDTLVPAAAGAAINALNSDIRLETINGAGHAPLLSHSHFVAGQIEALCTQVQQQQSGVEVR